jgi:hypothetical protein
MKTILFLLFYSFLVVQSFAQFDNDLGISEPRFQEFWEYEEGGNFRDLEYSIYPISQLREFRFNAKATNYGVLTQTNVVLQVQIDGSSETLTSSPVNIAPGEFFIFEIAPWMPPLGQGPYTVNFTIISEEEDDFQENNSAQKTFVISLNEVSIYPDYVSSYARDSRFRDGAFTDFTSDYKIGTAFYIENPATLYGLGVALAQGTVPNTSFNMELLSFPELEYIAESWLVTTPNSNQLNGIGGSSFQWVIMENPINLVAGMNYVVVVNHFGGDDNVIVSTSGYSPDQSSFYYLGDEATWYYTNATPMVRMAIESAPPNPGCTDPLALNYSPYANIDDGSCEYPNPFECEVAYQMFPDTIGGEVIWAVLDYSSAGNTTFLWNFGDGNESSDAYSNHIYNQEGEYNLCVTIIVTDDLGEELCTATFCDTISLGFLVVNIVSPIWLSVEEQLSNKSFTIFPNPSSGLLNVLYNGSLTNSPTIQFYDISGRLLQSEIIPVINDGQQHVFDVSKLPAGIYFVSIESGSGRETHKMLKQ